MRASDAPRRARRRISGRAILIAVGVLFLLVVVFGRAVARFYIDFLWHDGLGRDDVFWGVIRAKGTLFVAFFLTFATLVGVNLFIADKLAPSRFPANVHPYVERFHELFGHRLRVSATSPPVCCPCSWPSPPRRSGSPGCCSATAGRSA